MPQTTSVAASPEDAEQRLQAMLARQRTDIMEKVGFTPVLDHASLITRFFAAHSNRYSPDHFDPVLKPILKQAIKRYDECRGHDFKLANEISSTEAVRAILALDLEKLVRRKR